MSSFDTLPEKDQINGILINPNDIYWISNPSEKVQLIAIEQKSSSIQYIKNPTEKVQLLAVKNDGMLLRFIENPSEKVRMVALETDSFKAIDYFNTLTNKEIIFLAKENPDALLQKYDNLNKKLVNSILKKHPWSIISLKKPCEEFQMTAIKNIDKEDMYEFIESLINPCEEAILYALNFNLAIFNKLKKPNRKIQEKFVKKVIEYYKKENLEEMYIKEDIRDWLFKINDSIVLHYMYSKIPYKDLKNRIKKSKYWKDDANLILEVINE